MAISLTHYELLKLLKTRGELPQGGRILEIGKANWYGDAPPSVVDPSLVDETNGYRIVEFIYRQLASQREGDLVAIDHDPTAVERGAFPHDLNTLEAGSGDCSYSLVINHGTAEHIFNIANVFRVMHDVCEVGGLMIHEAPFTGWTSHGFYNLQPSLFYDLARENGYEMVLVATEHLRSRSFTEWPSHESILQAKFRDQLPDHSMLFVAMRKKLAEPFKIPTQGVYCGSASEFESAMWRVLR